MTKSAMTDERLMAYADGALAPDEAAEVEAALAHEPALTARVEMYRETAARLASLAEAERAEAPDPLAARIREMAGECAPRGSGGVTALAARRRAFAPVGRLALAAGVSLVIGVAGTYAFMRGAPDSGGGHGRLLAGSERPGAIRALDTLPSGERREVGEGVLTAVSTFNAPGGALCREVEYAPATGEVVASVFCRDGAGWKARLAVAAGPAGEGGYAPAGSLSALDAFLTDMDAGPPLSLSAEAAALGRLKKR